MIILTQSLSVLSWITTVSLLSLSVNALYEDQAGTFDWYKPFIGHISVASFHKSKPRVFVSTEQGVVGALNLRDGSIAYRHKLSSDSSLLSGSLSLLIDNPAIQVSVSESAVQAWEQTDGLMRWNRNLPASTCKLSPALLSRSSGQILVVASGSLQVLDAATGKTVKSVDVPTEACSHTTAHIAVDSKGAATVFTFTPGSSNVVLFDENGAATAVLTAQPLSQHSTAGPAGLSAISKDLSHVCHVTLSGSSSCTSLTSLGAASSTLTSPVSLVATKEGCAVASHATGALLLKAGSDASLTATATFKSASAVSHALDGASEQVVSVIDVQAKGTVQLQHVSVATGKVLLAEGPVQGARSATLAPGVAAPTVKAAFLGSFTKKDKSEGYRTLLVWTDERVTFLQQGVTVWTRDEGLAGVAAAMFGDLPPSGSAGGALPDLQTRTSQFLNLQLLGAKVQFKIANAEEVEEFSKLRAALSDNLVPARDSRGFRRSLLVSTVSGGVAALHNGDGRLLWSRPGPVDRAAGSSAAPQHLLHWRTYHDLTHAPQVATISAAGGGSVVSVLDAYTGKEISSTQLSYKIDKLVPMGKVSEAGHSDQQVFLAVTLSSSSSDKDTSPTVHVIPDTPQARSHFAANYRSLYFLTEATDATPFRGYTFASDAADAIAQGKGAVALPAWSLALPEPVINWSVLDPSDPVHTSVKVLGDRSMKYKYLNPNTMVIVTGRPAGLQTDTTAKDTTAATIYVVDTVTGSILHQQTSPGCAAPATSTMTENIAVVQCWNTEAARFQVISLELYDASERAFSVLDHLFNPNATQPQSSFNIPPIEVLTSSFFIRTPAKALTTSRTRAGITSKVLLALTHTDQVYTLDMRFLDPRRPHHTKLTPEEQEERLIPYQDTLPLVPNQFASYNKQILGLKDIISAASRLESTSLLFSYGLDLQYTRVAPAKGFDSLDDDFSYGLLIVALIGLTVASVFLHVFTKKSTLKAKWQ